MKKILGCILFLTILTTSCSNPDKNNPVYNWNIYLANGETIKAYDLNISNGWLELRLSGPYGGITAYPPSQVLKIEKIKK